MVTDRNPAIVDRKVSGRRCSGFSVSSNRNDQAMSATAVNTLKAITYRHEPSSTKPFPSGGPATGAQKNTAMTRVITRAMASPE
ncbi:MAG: hypothetical protein OXF99_00220 [bacterium]|nr:hypothetical protein [bacterium]